MRRLRLLDSSKNHAHGRKMSQREVEGDFSTKNFVKVSEKVTLFNVDPIYVLRKRAAGAASSEAGRYIGVTSVLPEQRLKRHLAEARNSRKSNHRLHWLRALEAPPDIEVIEWVLPMHRVEREKYWIALFRDYGHKLVNGTDGGEGTLGIVRSFETRAKLSAAMSAARTGKKLQNSSSDFHGVSWNKDSNYWEAGLTLRGRREFLGNFSQEEDAAHAVDTYVRANKLSPKLLNFP